MGCRVKIFVVAHKPFGMPEGEALVPVHVGRAVSRLKGEMTGMAGDDTGENERTQGSGLYGGTADWRVFHPSGPEDQDCTLL